MKDKKTIHGLVNNESKTKKKFNNISQKDLKNLFDIFFCFENIKYTQII